MGNPDLKSEDGWGADLTLVFSFKKTFSINSTVYGEYAENSIHWNNGSGSWRPENSGTAAFFGWDNKLKWVLPFSAGPFDKPIIGLSWLFQLSWLLSGDLSRGDNRRIPYMPVHTLGASLELPWKTGSLLFSGRFESTRYADTGNIVELAPAFILNIIYNQKLNKNLGLFARINNALNTGYVSFADYPMPGISLTLGMNMIFEGL
jgi:vitamin B12 transporter